MTDDNSGELESVDRFSARAAEYSRHRPEYPRELFDFLEKRGFIDIGTQVADVGAGTGIFTEQLMEKGCEVWAIEPNSAMRGIAEARLQSRHQFHSISTDAADIPLEDESVDLVTAAQAFHWFDPASARREFSRILRPPNRVALVWNIRQREGDPFMEDLEALIAEYGIDYEQVYETYDEHIDELDNLVHKTFDHTQTVREHGLLGLVTSFSYMPRPSEEGFDEMVEALQTLFEEYAEDGTVDILYNTELHFGTLDE